MDPMNDNDKEDPLDSSSSSNSSVVDISDPFPNDPIDEIYPANDDPESYDVENLTEDKVGSILEEVVTQASNILSISPPLMKLLLIDNLWDVEKIIFEYENNGAEFLIKSRIIPGKLSTMKETDQDNNTSDSFWCPVCMCETPPADTLSSECQHKFCRDCWTKHVEIKVTEGFSTEITCMMHKCELLLPEDFALSLPLSNCLKEQYQTFAFQNYVRSHPKLRFCIGPNCDVIFKADEVLPKRVICSKCNTRFCFKCGGNYHAPTDCATIKDWLIKCAEDNQTANYLNINTKDCPHCKVCIEKNGGCNHMRCFKCKYEFCWVCLGDWKTHSDNYHCSKYTEKSDLVNERSQARAALQKYLHYYERWQNHANSLKLEEKTKEKIKERMDKKVMDCQGTWIDWQYLLDAADLLANCRYTLQYTYPYAYFMTGPLKELFEYQQAELEAEIENLSWKVERAEVADRANLITQMNRAEQRRTTLLKEFFQPHTVPVPQE